MLICRQKRRTHLYITLRLGRFVLKQAMPVLAIWAISTRFSRHLKTDSFGIKKLSSATFKSLLLQIRSDTQDETLLHNTCTTVDLNYQLTMKILHLKQHRNLCCCSECIRSESVLPAAIVDGRLPRLNSHLHRLCIFRYKTNWRAGYSNPKRFFWYTVYFNHICWSLCISFNGSKLNMSPIHTKNCTIWILT